MMKKGMFLIALAAGLYALGPAPSGGSPPSDLTTAYLKGRVALEPDPDFARGVDWGELFPGKYVSVAVAPDGSVFVANSRDHNVSMFGPGGAPIKTFGRRGQGPGDLEYPGNLSILDGAYLVVGEYMSNRRISVFELDGTFRAVYKTGGPAASPVALGGGKVAYVGLTGTIEPRGDGFVDVNTNRVMILDTATGQERQVTLIKTSMNKPRDGEVRIARSAEGDLLVGQTIRPEIEVYALDGGKKGVIKLAIDPVPVTKKVAEAYQVKARISGKLVVMPMGDHLPYFCDLEVDAEGNLLVFKTGEDPKTGPLVFQVYTPAGKFLCETELVRGAFDLPVDGYISPRLAFTARGIYGILPLRGDELETPRLFRSALAKPTH
jgi:hypothetical protein